MLTNATKSSNVIKLLKCCENHTVLERNQSSVEVALLREWRELKTPPLGFLDNF